MVYLLNEQAIGNLLENGGVRNSMIQYKICHSIVVLKIHKFDYLLDLFHMRHLHFPN